MPFRCRRPRNRSVRCRELNHKTYWPEYVRTQNCERIDAWTASIRHLEGDSILPRAICVVDARSIDECLRNALVMAFAVSLRSTDHTVSCNFWATLRSFNVSRANIHRRGDSPIAFLPTRPLTCICRRTTVQATCPVMSGFGKTAIRLHDHAENAYLCQLRTTLLYTVSVTETRDWEHLANGALNRADAGLMWW